MKRNSTKWAILASALACFCLEAGAVRAELIATGQKLPPVSGRNLQGATISLDSFQDKSVLVVAFWSIYCKPCTAEISSLIKLQERYRGKLSVIGIATDGELPPARIRTFIERYEQFEKKKINYEIIFDEHNQITKLLGVGFLPTVLAVDASGTLINSFVGFDEKDEDEIFQGIEKMLPVASDAPADENTVFEVNTQVPACGFYDENGWREDFYGGKDLDTQLDKVAGVAREIVLKKALKKALSSLGVNLHEKEENTDCFKPYGLLLQENPWNQKDCLTNLLKATSFRKYTQVLETDERWLGTEYYVRQKVSVNLPRLKDDLEDLNLSFSPVTISFVVINMGRTDRMRFDQALLSQSKYIGQTDFPAYTIYASQETFIAELEKMDFAGTRVFFGDAGAGVIEAELWR